MTSFPNRPDAAAARLVRVAAPSLRRSGGGYVASFELPLEQVVALAQFLPDGIPESELAHRLGAPAADAAKIRQLFLRRRLVRRDPPGRARVGSRLILTDRGQRAITWLNQFQASLSPSRFDLGELTAGVEQGPDDLELEPDRQGAEPPGRPLARGHQRWRRRQRRDQAVGFEPVLEDGIFERGLLNVWVGTALFLTAVVVGVLHQSERAGLIALGVGCLIALVFLSRAAFVLIRQHRARTARARNARAAARTRRRLAFRRHRHRSGGA